LASYGDAYKQLGYFSLNRGLYWALKAKKHQYTLPAILGQLEFSGHVRYIERDLHDFADRLWLSRTRKSLLFASIIKTILIFTQK